MAMNNVTRGMPSRRPKHYNGNGVLQVLGAIGNVGVEGAKLGVDVGNTIYNYDFAAYWKMRFVDTLLSMIDRQERTNAYVLWFIDIAMQYLGQGDYLTFFGIFAGLMTLRNANQVITLKDIYSLLPEEAGTPPENVSAQNQRHEYRTLRPTSQNSRDPDALPRVQRQHSPMAHFVSDALHPIASIWNTSLVSRPKDVTPQGVRNPYTPEAQNQRHKYRTLRPTPTPSAPPLPTKRDVPVPSAPPMPTKGDAPVPSAPPMPTAPPAYQQEYSPFPSAPPAYMANYIIRHKRRRGTKRRGTKRRGTKRRR
jgi:hypothetical protein